MIGFQSVGVRQECVMSPWVSLFSLFMDGVMKEVTAKILERDMELVHGGGTVRIDGLYQIFRIC